MKKSVALLVTLFLCFWGCFGFCATNPSQPDQVKLQADYKGLPLTFIKNQGQVDEEVLYYLKGREGTIYFTKSGIVYDLIKKEVRSQETDVGAQRVAPNDPESGISDPASDVGAPVPAPNDDPASAVGAQCVAPNNQAPDNQTFSRLSFTLKPQGANPEVTVIPQDELPGKVNYFIGDDPQKWHTNIPIYKSIVYQNLYPGIDLKVYGANRQMEYDFIVHPGADPKQISLAGEGIDGLETDAEGNLLIKTALTDIKHLRPIIYQEINGQRSTVNGSFTVNQNRIGFDIKNYNKDYPLTIDPLTLSYSTFLGGSGADEGEGIAVDNSGCAYVVGKTASSSFPTANGYDPSYNSNTDVFVTKLNSSGNALAYSTFLGGGNDDRGNGIAVNSSGCAYVIGNTTSSNFPTATPYQATRAGNIDVFVTKFTAAGNALAYSTFLGGSGNDYGHGIAVDSAGCAYVTGDTASSNFPTANAYDSSYNSNNDAFVTKLTAAGNALSYSTYLGGSSGDSASGISIDSSGSAYVTGYTSSTNFPTATPYQATKASGNDVFITKLTAAGNILSYSTYLGGSSDDCGYGIAIDNSGCAYVTGYTWSSNFPTANPYDSSSNGNTDAFVTKLTFGTPPVADFSGAPTSGYAPLTVTFTDQSTNNPTSWSWNFGDNTPVSTEQNPIHPYNDPGTYTVSLTATNAAGNDTETKTGYITVNACPVPAADFTGAPTSGYAPLTVSFTDASTNSPTSWSWNFGDTGTSTQQNPSHQYTTPGTHTVSLIATNACGNDTETKTGYITVNVPPDPGTIAGKVTQADGVTAISGALMQALQDGTVMGSANTNSSGNYTIPNLLPGAYDVRASAGGYIPQTQTGVTVTSNQTTTINFSLSQASGDITYIYDEGANGIGRLTTMIDYSGAALFVYDMKGRPANTTRIIDGVSYTIESAYDSMDRITSVAYPDSEEVSYTYNAQGLVESIGGYTTAIHYNAADQMTSVTYPNGVTTVYQYYTANLRLYSITTNNSTQGLQNVSYNYDNAGNIIAVTDLLDSAKNQTFGYDDLNRLTQAQGPYGPLTYDYDPIGNMTYNSQIGDYTYGTKPHAVTAAGGNTYTYDENGNMVSGAGRTLTYNHENMPVSINAMNFVYDGNNSRVKKDDIVYIEKLYECTGSSCIKYIFANGIRIALKRSTGQVYYYSQDHLGSTTVVTDSTGAKVEEIHYYPYGATRTDSGSISISQKYTGQALDSETGLYYYGARYYDPVLARFISADNVVPDYSDPQNLNRLAYCRNNPMIYVDPSGNFTLPGFDPKIYNTGLRDLGGYTGNITDFLSLGNFNNFSLGSVFNFSSAFANLPINNFSFGSSPTFFGGGNLSDLSNLGGYIDYNLNSKFIFGANAGLLGLNYGWDSRSPYNASVTTGDGVLIGGSISLGWNFRRGNISPLFSKVFGNDSTNIGLMGRYLGISLAPDLSSVIFNFGYGFTLPISYTMPIRDANYEPINGVFGDVIYDWINNE